MGAEANLNGPQGVEQFKRGFIVPAHTRLVANDLDLPANVFSAFQKMAIGQEQVGPFLSERDHRRAGALASFHDRPFAQAICLLFACGRRGNSK